MDLVSKSSKSKYRRRNLSLRGVAFEGLIFLLMKKAEERVMLRVEKEQKENVTVIF